MAAKYIELEEAAKMLGVSPDELNDMRLRNEIHGMRDGSSWKFKTDELERVAEERGIDAGGDDSIDFDLADDGGSSDLAFDLEDDDDELNSPTVIGGALDEIDEMDPPEPGASTDLGIPLDDDSGLSLESDGGSEVDLAGDSGGDILGGSDLSLEGDGDDLGFDGSDLGLGSDLTLEDNVPSPAGTSGAELMVEDDDGLVLDDDDDELVLEGSGSLSGGAGDTGINLSKPSDSGLNLEEEPLDLAGSSVSSLELPEDDDIIDLDDLEAGPDEATQLNADEDFQLEPSAFSGDDDEEDSGSQVIALEDSEAFDGAMGMLGDDDGAVLGAESVADELEGTLDQPGATPVTQPGAGVYAPAPEMPYSIWNVLSLLVIVMLLALTGMLMGDLIRNMWSWEENYTASTQLMDMMISMFGLEP